MKKIILLLAVVSTVTVVANPFDRFSMRQYQQKAIQPQRLYVKKRYAQPQQRSHDFSQKRKVISAQRIVNQPSQQYFFAKDAAAKGNARAQFDLALMYARGTNGVAHNEKMAFHWFHKAARNKHVEAKFYMGLSFAQGRGVKKQSSLARYWFRLAVKAGHRQAMAHLASIENSLNHNRTRGYRISYNTHNTRSPIRTF